MSARTNPSRQLVRLGVAVLAMPLLLSCSDSSVEVAPSTIEPAGPATAPAVTTSPAGEVQPLAIDALDTIFDSDTGALVVLGTQPTVGILAGPGPARTVALPEAATAICGDETGVAYLATRGGYFRLDIADAAVHRIDITGQESTEFTAIALRADGNLVLGSAEGRVLTLDSPDTVGAEFGGFARVDDLVTRGDTAVVLDRAQTLVTTVNAAGDDGQHALRAGQGATTMATDPEDRVLVADTRGGELLVYSVDPLMLRQRYPVPDAPYGLAGSAELAWVSQTAANTVIGYDLATGIPVEQVRYPTVQQPNALAFDDSSGTLYVVSGSGAGVQIISDAAVSR